MKDTNLVTLRLEGSINDSENRVAIMQNIVSNMTELNRKQRESEEIQQISVNDQIRESRILLNGNMVAKIKVSVNRWAWKYRQTGGRLNDHMTPKHVSLLLPFLLFVILLFICVYFSLLTSHPHPIRYIDIPFTMRVSDKSVCYCHCSSRMKLWRIVKWIWKCQ